MTLYWLLFLFFTVGSLHYRAHEKRNSGLPIGYVFGGVLLILMIGFRYRVGADWVAYERMQWLTAGLSFTKAMSLGDPTYQAINWVAGQNNLDLWFTNLICAAIYVFGLLRFAAAQPKRWLALVVAIPYMTIVVAMGYTRQGAALGLVLAGLASFQRTGSIVRFAAYTAAAATFHSTAVVIFPLVALAVRRNSLSNTLIAAFIAFALFTQFLVPGLDHFMNRYIKAQYSSQGAAIRIAINDVAAIMFFILGRHLNFSPQEHAIWRNFAWASVALTIALIISPSSTAIDRLAIYIMPLQIAVFSRIGYQREGSGFTSVIVIAYSALILLVWLFFAQHSRYWLPYRSFLL